jgi:hypothetical protein
MRKFNSITLVNSSEGDWIGIYIDGKLVCDNHCYDVDDVLSILGIEYEQHWVEMEDGSRLPPRLEDLKGRIHEGKEPER